MDKMVYTHTSAELNNKISELMFGYSFIPRERVAYFIFPRRLS